jgi:Do/DeqQ family serine protease
MKKLMTLVLVAFLGGVISIGFYKLIGNDQTSQVAYLPVNGQPAAMPVSGYMSSYPVPENVPDFVDAADLTVHAVVHIKTELRRRNSVYDDFFNQFFGMPNYQYNQPVVATGSGVIITQDGYIVTNNHVVQNADRLQVTLNDKRSYDAEIVGTDPSTDLALIKINDSGLPFLNYGDSDKVRVGEWVLAVGNPFNLTSTVTAGIVSAKARNINILGTAAAIESFIQTDAPINPGNSGGALVNTKGELIGINAAIASNTGSFSGYSFAIPVNIAKKVVSDLIAYGEIQRAYIGVTIRDIDSQFAEELKLKNLKGVYVVSVVDNSSAADADIRSKDVIYRIEGKDINSVSQLMEAIGQHNPGDRISVILNRDGSTIEKTVLLKNKENSFTVVPKNEKSSFDELGATFEQITAEDKANYGIDYGIKVSELRQGKLMNKGVREGFIITDIDKTPIRSGDDLKNVLKNKKGGVLIEGVFPNGQRAYFAIGL